MLRVNFKEIPWEDELSVEELLNKLGDDNSYNLFLRSNVTVIINNEIVSPSEYGTKLLQDGDNVRIYPAIGGG